MNPRSDRRRDHEPKPGVESVELAQVAVAPVPCAGAQVLIDRPDHALAMEKFAEPQCFTTEAFQCSVKNLLTER